jgi:thiamine thiazole synthase
VSRLVFGGTLMELDEVVITKAIVEEYFKVFLEYTDVDVALVGGGPANLVAARYLAESGIKTVLFEKKLSLGGGMWGGGMMFSRIVVQEEAKCILEDFGIRHTKYQKGYYVANSIEAVGKLISGAIDAGAKLFNLVEVEDVMIRENDRVCGLVINWATVSMGRLPVDPLAIRAKLVVDGTGHDSFVCSTVQRKVHGSKFKGKPLLGEKPMWADVGERMVVDATGEVYPGLLVAGMAATAVSGSPRMGPVFGGMLLSGKKIANIVQDMLKI